MAKRRKYQPQTVRQSQVTIILGKNGTGKSTLVEKIIKGVGGRTIAVTMNGIPEIWEPYPIIDPARKDSWKFEKGIRQVVYMQHEKETFRHIYWHFRKGNLVLDDCRSYISSNIDHDKYLKRLLIDFRHLMLDVYFIAHSPTQLPKQVWTFYSNAFIGATDALLNTKEIDSYQRIIEAQRAVNREFREAQQRNDGSQYGIFRLVQP
ncbi:ATP-binding protein [Flavilitoribacter nigricans]|uniref:ATP-binding cassette domain-containing protein n=1 Tax=Flavilitoribacter nigricans (strain ATCC 23147 / DSM 23189 / NBRC 102662 / NCIMB 1420 / SS-2) TaxID=1122177 RepID=A0A2D0NEE7_FLAN2|nr:ATP-binding protein [Flavilitoribacter nigricans]PHN06153.1 hypothetical protein CRP01_11250 [Flavilitoribacter nigricans DSM 23189 = NBRC 102662]